MTNTIESMTMHADLGMPMSGRSWVADLRALPMTSVIPAMSAEAGQTCVLVQETAVAGHRSAMDIAVRTGAFPGASAWSPPS